MTHNGDIHDAWLTLPCMSVSRATIGVSSYGSAMGHMPSSTSSNKFFSWLRSHTKSITTNSVWFFFIWYSFVNVWNWQQEAFYDATESTKIVFVQGLLPRSPLWVLTTLSLIPRRPGRGYAPPVLYTIDTLRRLSLGACLGSCPCLYQILATSLTLLQYDGRTCMRQWPDTDVQMLLGVTVCSSLTVGYVCSGLIDGGATGIVELRLRHSTVCVSTARWTVSFLHSYLLLYINVKKCTLYTPLVNDVQFSSVQFNSRCLTLTAKLTNGCN